jgi:hypothetical protein
MATWRNAGARNRPIGVPLPSLVPEFLRGYASAQLQHHDPGGWEARNSLNHSTGRTLLYEARQGEVPTAQLQAQEQRLQCPDGGCSRHAAFKLDFASISDHHCICACLWRLQLWMRLRTCRFCLAVLRTLGHLVCLKFNDCPMCLSCPWLTFLH